MHRNAFKLKIEFWDDVDDKKARSNDKYLP